MRLSPHVAFLPISASVLVSTSALAVASLVPQSLQRIITAMSTIMTKAFPPGSPKGDFDTAVRLILRSEGGFVNDPRDPGGATNFGVSLSEVKRMEAAGTLSGVWRRRFDADHDGVIDEKDVRLWDVALAKDFYREFYWNPVRGSELPASIATMLFDSAVNEGVQKAAMHLQKALRVQVDGKVGPKTILAAWEWKLAPGALRPEEEVFLSRLTRYASLKGAPTYFAGWARRTFVTLREAQATIPAQESGE